MAKFKSASIYLFVILLLVLVVSMLFGFQSVRQKVVVTEGIATQETPKLEKLSTETVSLLDKPCYKVFESNDLTVWLDCVDPLKDTFSVILKTLKNNQSQYAVLPYNSTSNATITMLSTLAKTNLPSTLKNPTEKYNWILNYDKYTIVYNTINKFVTLFIFEKTNDTTYDLKNRSCQFHHIKEILKWIL